jgi:hypothetical protein
MRGLGITLGNVVSYNSLLDAMARPGKVNRFAPVALTPPSAGGPALKRSYP